MIEPGQVVLFRFPHTDLQEGKLRPTLLVAKVPGRFDDWLACAISTQLHQQVPDFDMAGGIELCFKRGFGGALKRSQQAVDWAYSPLFYRLYLLWMRGRGAGE